MKIHFKTNLDVYRMVYWPELNFVPRKGEYVYVKDRFKSYCLDRKIPDRLEVCRVEYHEHGVEIELWYSDIDFKLYNSGDRKLLEIH